MAISKIKLGNAAAVDLRDAASMHYVGHATAGITEAAGVYTSGLTPTGLSHAVKINDYITYGDGNENFICVNVVESTATWELLSEAAVIPPVQDVKIGNTSLVTNYVASIPTATTSSVENATFGVVKTGDNITNNSGVISVADAAVGTKGVVELVGSVGTSATAATNKAPTEKAVADAIAELPQAMIFRGTLDNDVEHGSGTVHALPIAAAQTAGDVYKVIEAATYDGQKAEVGDLFICAQGGTAQSPTYSWILIPSGDVPAGTVTSVGAAAAASSNITVTTDVNNGDPITASGTITVGVAADHTIPANTDIATWNATSTQVDAFSNSSAVTNVSTSAPVSPATATTVNVIAVDGSDEEQLNISPLYIYADATAVFGTIPTPPSP